VVVSKADDDENDGQKDETHKLDGLAADSIDGGHGDPVARNGASANNDQITNGRVAENVVDIITLGIANGLENDRVVETKTVESDICRSSQYFPVQTARVP
jgi:hypothetical protein